MAKIPKKVLTLAFIRRDDQILLGRKKRGFGEGKWNGFGGKVDLDETISDAAVREVREECGLLVTNLKKLGVIDFEFVGDPVILNVHVFSTVDFTGNVTESEEMSPQWYKVHEVPFEKMWKDDPHWFPYMLDNKKFNAYFLFEGHEKIISHWIKEVESLDE
ncbi:oxidized purine nucleoside triphosphate hydrolase-like isoform X1 [Artemia franciscana]|uniref:Oxidized purine nucleoside triphosphate hydrolase n=1 Tax=Artemia franciscana TaxID=6661 RepID=A0AA88HCV4_ARTSF|nr:hypothetical protein QYM36_018254 [Artemia franciscana]KAK2703232.1 hypothetical protein QYM36_018254 [Artemia franciscana]